MDDLEAFFLSENDHAEYKPRVRSKLSTVLKQKDTQSLNIGKSSLSPTVKLKPLKGVNPYSVKHSVQTLSPPNASKLSTRATPTSSVGKCNIDLVGPAGVGQRPKKFDLTEYFLSDHIGLEHLSHFSQPVNKSKQNNVPSINVGVKEVGILRTSTPISFVTPEDGDSLSERSYSDCSTNSLAGKSKFQSNPTPSVKSGLAFRKNIDLAKQARHHSGSESNSPLPKKLKRDTVVGVQWSSKDNPPCNGSSGERTNHESKKSDLFRCSDMQSPLSNEKEPFSRCSMGSVDQIQNSFHELSGEITFPESPQDSERSENEMDGVIARSKDHSTKSYEVKTDVQTEELSSTDCERYPDEKEQIDNMSFQKQSQTDSPKKNDVVTCSPTQIGRVNLLDLESDTDSMDGCSAPKLNKSVDEHLNVIGSIQLLGSRSDIKKRIRQRREESLCHHDSSSDSDEEISFKNSALKQRKKVQNKRRQAASKNAKQSHTKASRTKKETKKAAKSQGKANKATRRKSPSKKNNQTQKKKQNKAKQNKAKQNKAKPPRKAKAKAKAKQSPPKSKSKTQDSKVPPLINVNDSLTGKQEEVSEKKKVTSLFALSELDHAWNSILPVADRVEFERRLHESAKTNAMKRCYSGLTSFFGAHVGGIWRSIVDEG